MYKLSLLHNTSLKRTMKGTHKNSEGLQSNVSLCKYTTTLGTSEWFGNKANVLQI